MFDSLLEGFHNLYLFATVFGAGVTLVDMLGVFGHGHDSGGHDGGGHAGHDGGSAHHGGNPQDAAHEGNGATTLLSVLRYLRMLVYFALGFGPTGLITETMGSGLLGSLAWAVPVGVASTFLARLFFRFQQKDLDSTVKDEDLLYEPATVIVPISGGNMGKVRVRIGPVVAERYALAEDAKEAFHTDEQVEIIQVTPESVTVRRIDSIQPPALSGQQENRTTER